MTNDVDIEERLEIKQLIGESQSNMKSAKLLIDNIKHLHWHTISEFWDNLANSLKAKGYEVLSQPQTSDYDIVGGEVLAGVLVELVDELDAEVDHLLHGALLGEVAVGKAVLAVVGIVAQHLVGQRHAAALAVTLLGGAGLALQDGVDLGHDVGGAEVVVGEHLVGGAALAETVVHGDVLHGRGAVQGEGLGDAVAEAAVEEVLLAGDDGAGLAGAGHDGLHVEGLDGVDVDDFAADA